MLEDKLKMYGLLNTYLKLHTEVHGDTHFHWLQLCKYEKPGWVVVCRLRLDDERFQDVTRELY